MTPEAAAVVDDVALLTELLASEDLWIERAAEADALATSILQSPAAIVVLLGPPRAGKTELLRRWIIPELSARFTVAYRDACDDEAAGDEPADIEVWDAFEHCLTDERLASGAVVAQIWSLLQRRRKVVLCVGDESLSRLFQLTSAAPQLRGEVLQIPLVSGERVVQTLKQTAIKYGISVGDSFLNAVAQDLNAMPPTASIGMELVAILVVQLRRSTPMNRELGKDEYVAAGGVNGLLEAHLDFVLERLPDGIDTQIAWAVMQTIATTPDNASLDLEEVARRFGVVKEIPCRVLDWLDTGQSILQRDHRGDYNLVPPQLVAAIEHRIRRDALAVEHIRGALQQGIRNFTVSELLLSPQTFRRVHGHRTAIKVSDEEAALMLRCALAYEDSQLAGASEYWLQRITAEPVRTEVLVEALFSADAAVRQRAVKRLAGVDQPEVRNQLHLLALRDPSHDVRADAVSALDAMKDHELKRSLLQEIHEPQSPYRLQAIEALRVFREPETTEALVEIVAKNAPGQDADARIKAIEVLGAQNTARCADALVRIALSDDDAEDRASAAIALRSITDEELLGPVLEQLRRTRLDASRFHPAFSVRAVAIRLVYITLAAVATIPSFFIQPLVPLVTRRWRLAGAIAMCQAVAIALGFASPEMEGVAGLLLIFTWMIADLIPIRTLLHERLDSKPQSSFRSCLSGVLFAFCSVSFFVVFHGLPSMLARRVRRGFILFGFEILAGLFFMSGLYFESKSAGLMGGFSAVFIRSFRVIGIGMAVVSYVVGVGTVLLEAFVFTRRRAAFQRIDDVCSRLLESPVVSAMVIRSLKGDSKVLASWGKELTSRHVDRMQAALCRQWPDADPVTQRRIFKVLARHHNADAVQFLRTVAPTFGWVARLRAAWAGLAFRFSVWPRPVLLALALILYAQGAISAGLYGIWQSHPDSLIKVVQDSGVSEQRRLEAVRGLRSAAQQTQDHEVAISAATKLMATLTAPGLPAAVRKESLESIVAVAPVSDKREDLVDAVAKLLYGNEPQAAIAALRRIGGPQASLKLAQFATDRIQFARQQRRVVGPLTVNVPRARSSDDATMAARGALEALTHIEECGEETVRLLASLAARSSSASSTADPGGIEGDVRDTILRLDPLSRAEYYASEQKYDDAITAGRLAAAKAAAAGSVQRGRRANAILSRAYAFHGMRALQVLEDETGKNDLYGALDAIGRTNTNDTSPILILGLQVAARFHEFHGPQDPQDFKIVYDVLTRIEPLAQDEDMRESVRVNLAESSLTTGRYDQAITLSKYISAHSADQSTVLNMQYILFAALTLKGDRKGADAALADLNGTLRKLPTGFANNWMYAGTTSYIQRVAPNGDKPVLLQTLTRVSTAAIARDPLQ